MHRETFGLATLWLGDCNEILPSLDKKACAVVTDPPYGIRAARDRNSEKYGWRDYDNGQWNDAERPSGHTLNLAISSGKNAIVWGGNYFLDSLPFSPQAKWLIWDKGQKDFSLADAELAWCSFDGAIRRITYSRSKAIQDGKEHPTQKAIEVMKWSILQLPSSPPCDTILDPFMGSGTTGIAAVQMNREFVGIEREKRYFDISCRRIESAKRQGQLFRCEA